MTWQITITGHEDGDQAADIEAKIADAAEDLVAAATELSTDLFQAQFAGLHVQRDYITTAGPDQAS